MLEELEKDFKKVLLAGIGAVACTAEKSKEMIDQFVKKGELTVEQGKTLNEELKRNIKSTVKENMNNQSSAAAASEEKAEEAAPVSPEKAETE